jgi:outer membrane protein TolC
MVRIFHGIETKVMFLPGVLSPPGPFLWLVPRPLLRPAALCLASLLATPAAAADLSLESAVDAVLSRNERALLSREATQAAEARRTQARAFFFPTLTVGANYTRRANETVRDVGGAQVTIAAYDAVSATGTARWTVFDARGIPLYRAAIADLDATRLESAEARRLLAFEAADAFLKSLSQAAVAEAARHRLEFATQSLGDARSRAQAGLASINELTRARLEEATAQRDKTRADAANKTARVHLGGLLDQPPIESLTPPSALLRLAAEGRPEEARAPRLDVRAANERTTQAEALAAEPLLRLVPSLSATAQVKATNETGLSGRVVDGYVGLDLSWVLFDGGDRYGDARERAAQARAAALAARARQRLAAVDGAAALVALEAARTSRQQAFTTAELSRQNAKETAELYRQGLANSLQVSDASLKQFEAEVALAQEEYALAVALLSVRAAVGVDPLGRAVEP